MIIKLYNEDPSIKTPEVFIVKFDLNVKTDHIYTETKVIDDIDKYDENDLADLLMHATNDIMEKGLTENALELGICFEGYDPDENVVMFKTVTVYRT